MTTTAAKAFVYYRVKAADATPAIAAASSFQTRLRASMPGLSVSLSRRVEGDGELLTLMETYTLPGAANADWQRDIERRAHDALAGWIVGERHVELFVPCA